MDIYKKIHDLCIEVDEKQNEVRKDGRSIIIAVADEKKIDTLVCTGYDDTVIKLLEYIARKLLEVEKDEDEQNGKGLN